MKDTFSFLFHNRSFLLALLALVLATLVLAALLSGWPGGTEVPPAPDETISSLDLRGTDVRIPEYLALKERYPNAEIRWDVPVGSGTFDSESTSILVPDYSAADRAALDLFPRLRAMDASGSKDYDALLSLWKEKPNFSVDWTVPVGDRVLPSRSASLLVNSDSVTARELGEAMARFPDIHRVIMDNCD